MTFQTRTGKQRLPNVKHADFLTCRSIRNTDNFPCKKFKNALGTYHATEKTKNNFTKIAHLT